MLATSVASAFTALYKAGFFYIAFEPGLTLRAAERECWVFVDEVPWPHRAWLIQAATSEGNHMEIIAGVLAFLSLLGFVPALRGLYSCCCRRRHFPLRVVGVLPRDGLHCAGGPANPAR